MELSELKISAFASLLASDAPAPGGGSAAALEGALGAALGAMVCSLTIGKKKYADVQELATTSKEKLDALTASFLDVMERDTRAFNVVSAAFALPKTTDAEKAARSAAIQDGLKGCTATPFEMMELATETLRIVSALVGKTNASASSDLGVAALSLRTAIQGAWLNVLINIGSLKDADLAADYRSKGEKLLAEALPIADGIYTAVASQM